MTGVLCLVSLTSPQATWLAVRGENVEAAVGNDAPVQDWCWFASQVLVLMMICCCCCLAAAAAAAVTVLLLPRQAP
jgi:hypothetical protein